MNWSCSPIWQAISFLATPIYTFLFAIALSYAALQIKEMKAVRYLTVSLSVFAEAQKLGNIETFQGLYAKFLEHDQLILSKPEQELATNVLRAFSHIGTLLQGGILAWDSPRFRLDADHYVRCWLLLENYVQHERAKRKDPAWRSAAQLVVFFGICSLIDQCRTPLVIFHPKDEHPSKEYSATELYEKALDLGKQLTEWSELPRKTVKFHLWCLKRKVSFYAG